MAKKFKADVMKSNAESSADAIIAMEFDKIPMMILIMNKILETVTEKAAALIFSLLVCFLSREVIKIQLNNLRYTFQYFIDYKE